MAKRDRQRFGFGRVGLARFRRAARGRAAWLVEDMRGGDGLPDLHPVRDRYPDDELTASERLPVPGRPHRRTDDRRPGGPKAGDLDPGAVRRNKRGNPRGGSGGWVPDGVDLGPDAHEDRAGRWAAPVPDDAQDGPADGPGTNPDGPLDGPGPVRLPVRLPSRLVRQGGPPERGPDADDWEDPSEYDAPDDGVPSMAERTYTAPGREKVWAVDGGRPLAPHWMRYPARTLQRRAVFELHRLVFHLLHVPEYVARALRFAPRGLRIEFGRLVRWAVDAEARELRWSAIARDDTREYLHLSRQRNQRIHNRVPAAIALVVVVLVAVLVGWWYSLATRIAVLLLVVGLLGWRGTPVDRELIAHATVPPQVRRVDAELLVQAFTAAKLCTLSADRPPGPIRFVTQVAVDGPGVKAVIELPAGKTAEMALGARVQIAAGLDVDEFRVFLQRQRGTAGSARRVEVWVADKDPYEDGSPVSPLVKAKTWDFWRGFPFGVDARGRLVVVPLVWSNLLIGSIPRMGKTNAARLAAAAAALDAYVRLIVFDGKGGKDWKPFEACAHFYASGVRQLVVEALLELLRDAVEDMNRRYEAMQDLPDDICEDGKVTPFITRRRGYQMPLTLICIDEVHRYLEHPDHGPTICALLTELIKAGPAAGYMLVLATQRPDAKAVPESLRGQMGTRFALRTMNWQASETILGAGTYTAGLDSSKFLPSHKGVGILRGAGDDTDLGDAEAITVRTHRMDLRGLRAITARGRQLRVGAGTLTGAAAGEEVLPEQPQRRVLDDVLDIFEPAEDRMWSETICARLAERWPQQYDGWDPTTLANVLSKFGVDTAQQWGRTTDGRGANRRGITRQALQDAIAARENRTITAHSVPDTGIPAAPEHPELPGTPSPEPLGDLAGDPASSSTPETEPDQGSSP